MIFLSDPNNENIRNSKRTWDAAGLFLQGNLMLQQEPTDFAMMWTYYFQAYLMQPDFSVAKGKLLQVGIENPSMRTQILDVLNERDKRRLKSLIE